MTTLPPPANAGAAMHEPEMGFDSIQDGSIQTVMQKMAQVARNVPYLRKAGYNDAMKYSFLSIEDTMMLLRGPIMDAGLFMNYSTVRMAHRDHHKGGTITSVTVLIQWTDLETGAVMHQYAVGDGFDTTDKAPAKAVTAALKQAFKYAFMLPTLDDVEIANEAELPITEKQKSVIMQIGEELGYTPQEVLLQMEAMGARDSSGFVSKLGADSMIGHLQKQLQARKNERDVAPDPTPEPTKEPKSAPKKKVQTKKKSTTKKKTASKPKAPPEPAPEPDEPGDDDPNTIGSERSTHVLMAIRANGKTVQQFREELEESNPNAHKALGDKPIDEWPIQMHDAIYLWLGMEAPAID